LSQKRGKVIVLNGASSAGKTWTAQALVKLLGAQCAVTGLDEMMERIQPFGTEGSESLRRSLLIAWFQLAGGRLRLFKRVHREVVGLAEAGRDVIVETALMDEGALRDAAECFTPLNGLFVGMKPPLAVSEQWERTRDDRPRGHARKHYDLIHAHGIYDLVLDPSTLTPHECAIAILKRLEGAPPDAFRCLQAR
jgi:chloramphenicol 3-O phosphotransferase